MAYPSTLSNITNPNASDKLNSPSHSALHTSENTAISELQTFVGTLASTAGTLIYDIRATASDGGGHVQGVNKGGTGFTSYTKGDLLVASSTSVLSKLAVNANDGYILRVNSSVATGVEWAANSAVFSNKIAVSGTPVVAGASIAAATEASFLSVTIPGSTLGTSNAVKATIFFSQVMKNTNNASVLLRTKFGANQTGSVLIRGTLVASSTGRIEHIIKSAGSSVLQRVDTYLNINPKGEYFSVGPAMVSVISGNVIGTSSVNSMADQNLVMTVQYDENSQFNFVETTGYVVEKIA